jgi:hypothetical protein
MSAQDKPVLQTIVFNKLIPRNVVTSWLRRHGYRWALDEKANTWRARQLDPRMFQPNTYFTKTILEGINFVFAKLKKEYQL